MLKWKLSAEDEARRMADYMQGKDPLKFEPRGAWFLPDRIENFSHDALPTENMTVYTQDGKAICGRFVENPTGHWIAVLPKEYYIDA